MCLEPQDARIVDRLQDGLPIAERPFAAAAADLGIEERVLIERLGAMLADGVLTRFGPLFNADALGGAYSLCALAVPEQDFERVAALVNAHPEVAHNYARAHHLNMWFVIATEHPGRIPEVIDAIERETGLGVLDLPKEAEYHVGLYLAAQERW
jgi:DNA-binding Lrp family transcriptional regulator